MLFRDELVEEIKRVQRMYTLLWRANGTLNSSFSLVLLLFIIITFIAGTFWLYIFSNSFLTSFSILQDARYFAVGYFAVETILLYISLTTADTPVEQVTHRNLFNLIKILKLKQSFMAKVNTIRKELVKLSVETYDMSVQRELSAFQSFLSEDQMRFSAAGLFHVGMHLVPSVRINSRTLFSSLIPMHFPYLFQ